MTPQPPTDAEPRSLIGPFASTQWVAGLFVAALLLRVGLAEYVLRFVPERLPDTDLYVGYARTIFGWEPYDLSGSQAARSPGYPLFIASCWSMVGEPSTRAVLWGQALLGTLTGVVIYAIGRGFERWGAPIGIATIAALVALLEPYGLMLGTLELSESLFAFLLTLTAGCILLVCRTRNRWASLSAGVVAGAAVLVRPSALLLVPLAALAAWMLAAKDSKPGIDIVVAILGLLLVLAPWTVRNAITLKAFVPLTTNIGESLFDGLNPRADGSSNIWFKTEEGVPPGEVAQNAYWRNQAWSWSQEHPQVAASLALRKLARYWSPWPNEPRFRRLFIVIGTTLFTVPFYLLALVGLRQNKLVGPGRHLLIVLSLMPIVYFSLIHMVFVSSVRYRAPAMPLVALLVGVGVAACLSARRTSFAS